MPRIFATHLRIAFITPIALATALFTGCKPGNIEIDTAYGVVAGIQDAHISTFLGVPYAKPPIGDLRWADPQPPQPWEGVYQATQFRSACVQAIASPLLLVPTSEDCLTLSIWAPTTPGPHPVMVWLHGGGNLAGAGGDPFTDGYALAQSQQVVIVAVNYRLSTIGFFALPSINGAEPINGNQGIKDQISALQWVHDEIARFGGDAGNVTVFGESSGAWNTCALLATPKTRTPVRLLHKAIMQSGYCERFSVQDLATAQQHGLDFLTAHGCNDASNPLACARALAPQVERQDPPPLVIDGDVFPQHPFDLIATNDQVGIPLLIGSNKDEGSRYAGPINHPADEAGYLQLLAQEFPGDEAALATLYPLQNYTNAGQAHSDIAGDQQVTCGVLHMARQWSAINDTWLYFLTHDVKSLYLSLEALGWGTNPPQPGAFHVADVGYLFPLEPLVSLQRASDKTVRDIFHNAWGNFARAGNPNGIMAPAWERFDAARDNYLDINANAENHDGFRAGYCDYWINRDNGN